MYPVGQPPNGPPGGPGPVGPPGSSGNHGGNPLGGMNLGTGLGPRSYAIIEQDMISKLVSAKPEEMRSYIEEVAGISRYLERRKETESRIKRTKENLNRLQDLREEIGRILFKLKQQARAAERLSLIHI